MRAAFLCAASLAALGGPPAAWAEDAAAVTVDPVSILGSRTEKLASETPATVSVITAEELEDRLAVDIRDVVKHEPGVSVRSSPARFGAALGVTGRDGNAGFNIRGLEGDRVLIQIDGVRLPDGFTFGAQAVGRGDYQDLDLIKSVEILRGPASALYGSDGVAGAVSFTTKDPGDFLREGDSWGGRLKGGYASADEGAGGLAVLAGRHGAWSAMLALGYRDARETETQGRDDSADTDRTKANPQDFLTRSALAKLVFQPTDTNRLRLTVERFDRDAKADVLSGIAKPPLSATSVLRLKAADTTERERLMLDQRWEPASGPVDRLAWAAWLQDSETVQFTAEDRNTAADRTRRNTFDNRVHGVSVQLESGFGLAGVEHGLVYGLEASRTRQSGVREGTVPPVGEAFPTRAFPTTDYTLVGAFVQDEVALFGGAVTALPALRFDHYDLDPKADALLAGFSPAGSDGGRISPKLGLVFRPGAQARLFVNYARGFKAPSPSEVNNAFSNPIQNYRSIPNPDLKAETSEAFEAGARWVTPAWAAEITAFTGEYENFIEQIQVGGSFTPTSPGVFQFVNLSRVKIRGVEARARARFESGFGGFVSAAYARGDSYSPAKSPLDSIDPVTVAAGVSYRAPGGRYGGELSVVHVARKAADRVAQACTPDCYRPAASTVVDLTAYWRVTQAATLRGGVFNLTDETYAYWNDVRGLSSTAASRDAYTQPGRNLALSLTYDF